MDNVKSLDPLQLNTKEVHKILLSSVAPRPIAFASTVDSKGNVNLSPFSYFNVFSSNPPILIFSPSRRVRDNTTKHTLENAKETKVKPPRVLESPISFECTVDNIVSLGESGGAGQLIIAKVIQIHINKDYLDTEGNIDSEKLELVARMGGDWYTKANKESMFKIPKP